MSAVRKSLSKIKWALIDNVLVNPIKFFMGIVYRPVMMKALQSFDSTGKLDFDGADIVMDVKSVSQLSRLRSCKKEPSTIQWLLRDVRDNDVFFDIGANIGAYSLVMAKGTNKNVTVYSFEPSPNTYAVLCKNVSLNQLGEKIFPLQMAVGTEVGIQKFFLSSSVAGAAEHSLGAPIDPYGNRFVPVDVQTVVSVPMDKLKELFNVPLPTHIKIDVDGIELQILENATSVLASDRLRHILVEVYESNADCPKIVALLDKYGFKLTGKGYPITPGFCNYEFSKA